jgi:hypothetical protein
LGAVEPVRSDADSIENVAVARGKKLLGFAQDRDGDAVRACGALPVGNSGALVVLTWDGN